MRIPTSLRRVTQSRGLRGGLCVALLLLLAACGGLLLTDRPGLLTEYFALGAPWEGKPFSRAVGAPGLERISQVGEHLKSSAAVSIRWSGWWEVAHDGEHRFFLDADDGGYLRIDGQRIVEVSAAEGERKASGPVVLAPGFHRIELGLFQASGDARLAIHWLAPGFGEESVTLLPLADLYAGRPLVLRKQLRRVRADWPPSYRQLLGAALLFTGLSLLGGFAQRFVGARAWLRERLPIDRRGLHAALLVALFVIVFLASFPHTGAVFGGDDTSYLDTATFNVKTWYVNRYGHVYLLKLFTALSGGDPLVGVRVWWSFVMASTVSALAVAVRSVGPGLQLRTLAATLFLLLAQPILWGLIGAGFADYSAMMFVTVAVAVYLHGVARDRERPPPRHEWHALAIGALTVGAIRSKEVGSVLLLLPLLFAIGPGSTLNLRRFVRKLAYWIAGALVAQSGFMLLDGWILGDFFFAWDEGRLASLRRMNFPSGVRLRRASWLNNIWHGREMRFLWTGVVAAAVVAGARRRELHLRLLHLLPIAYMLALIALYVRLPHPFSNRMLIPILPSACLMTGLLLHYAGLDGVPWRRIVRPFVLIPAGVAAAAVFLVVLPLQSGTLDAATLLPADLLRRYGWEVSRFVAGVILPAAVLIAFGGVALVAGRRLPRVVALVLAYLIVFGVGFEVSRTSLARKRAVLTSELLLYPWRTFREELNAHSARVVMLSWDLRGQYRMTATTRSSLAKLALGRRGVSVGVARDLPAGADAAIASRDSYLAWLREMPTLAETATFGPSGFLVLVRPKEAAERASRLPAAALSHAREETSVAQRIAELQTEPDAAATLEMLQWMLAYGSGSDERRSSGSLVSLLGTQLRAFYVTTPIYYVNDLPHIGHIYTTVVADAVARYRRLAGDDVYFLTGTDEHGQKIERAAREQGRRADGARRPRGVALPRAVESSHISHDDFIRTTESGTSGGREMIRRIEAAGRLLRGAPRRLVLPGVRAFYTEKELRAGRLCPDHERPTEWKSEENVFFRLSRYQQPLLDSTTDVPASSARRAAQRGPRLRRGGLKDLSCRARTSPGGSPFPGTRGTSVYVWLDALTNYISPSASARRAAGRTAISTSATGGAPRRRPAAPGRQGHPALPRRLLAGLPDVGRAAAADHRLGPRLVAARRAEDVEVGPATWCAPTS
jgi:hypothetical protein